MKTVHLKSMIVALAMTLTLAFSCNRTSGGVSPVEMDFEQAINSQKYVLVDFWAEWCGPCRMIAPNLDKISGEMSDKLAFTKVDVDQEGGRSLAQRYQIDAIPCLILFADGQEVSRSVGYSETDELREWLSKYVK